jgi:hypothetical protein
MTSVEAEMHKGERPAMHAGCDARCRGRPDRRATCPISAHIFALSSGNLSNCRSILHPPPNAAAPQRLTGVLAESGVVVLAESRQVEESQAEGHSRH